MAIYVPDQPEARGRRLDRVKTGTFGPLARVGFLLVRRACSAANGCKSRLNLMEVKGSEAQGRHREVGSEGSVEQRCGPMYKNRIRGLRRRTSWPVTTKSVSIKDAGGKSGGRVSKAAELIAGDLRHVADSRLRVK